MVYCTKCGSQNDEEAKYCKKCGTFLVGAKRTLDYYNKWNEKGEKGEKEEKLEKGEKTEKREKTEEEARFWGILLGLILILVGIFHIIDRLFRYRFWWASWDRLGVMIVIIIGFFFILGGIRARRRSPKP